jgi:hypothetical protein
MIERGEDQVGDGKRIEIEGEVGEEREERERKINEGFSCVRQS